MKLHFCISGNVLCPCSLKQLGRQSMPEGIVACGNRHILATIYLHTSINCTVTILLHVQPYDFITEAVEVILLGLRVKFSQSLDLNKMIPIAYLII